jgi:nucleoside-diphosphate-sugar epimerase
MVDALIGHTGFVGGTLAARHRFAACFNSKNIEAIRGQRFDTLVVSGMPAAKWLANRDSLGDRAVLDRLWGNLKECKAKTVIVISTVDVYPAPIGVDEGTIIEPSLQQPYGRHRLELEHRVSFRFPRVLAVRLPGLYGPGLKKNAIYDLIHNNGVEKIHPDGTYQFYNLNRLWPDIQTSLAANLTVANLVTEPVTMREVGRAAFGFAFGESPKSLPPRYDVRTMHAALLGGHGRYLESKAEVLAGIASFVANERAPLRAAA